MWGTDIEAFIFNMNRRIKQSFVLIGIWNKGLPIASSHRLSNGGVGNHTGVHQVFNQVVVGQGFLSLKQSWIASCEYPATIIENEKM
jgi:hypothetical protein